MSSVERFLRGHSLGNIHCSSADTKALEFVRHVKTLDPVRARLGDFEAKLFCVISVMGVERNVSKWKELCIGGRSRLSKKRLAGVDEFFRLLLNVQIAFDRLCIAEATLG